MFSKSRKTSMVRPEDALRGRGTRIQVPRHHAVLGTSLEAPFHGLELGLFGMGCFWGAERTFWQAPGVHSTSVGYAGGHTPNPTYEEVCSGLTGHAEVVQVVYDPRITSYDAMLKIFWEHHDPTQGMRQGNDIGTQYRSAVYWFFESQKRQIEATRDAFQAGLSARGFGPITTEIAPATVFYFAEDYHQQYLHKNPDGYCGLGGTGVTCPVGVLSRTG
jgi:peptide-methionine (S)-S-oxide reductase